METKLKRPISFLLAFIVAMVFNFPIGVTNGIKGIFDFGMPAKAEDITPTKPTTGDGSSGNPYQIGTAAELYWFANFVNGSSIKCDDGQTYNTAANAKLTADITVNKSVLKEDGTLNSGTFTPWTPIGNNSSEYKGTFDGDGHTISGLYFSDTKTDYVGLFGYLYNNGKIQNVGVIDSYFNGKNYVGGVCGYSYYKSSYKDNHNKITNCYNTGTVSGTSNVGGVCGYNNCYLGSTNSIIENCYNTGKVTGSSNVGGVSGYNYSSKVTNCYNTGTVSGDSYVGGVSGYNTSSSVIENCYTTGTVSGTSSVGSVCGYNQNSAITNCYYRADSETDSISGTIYKDEKAFANGEVCYLLNGSTGTGDNLAWGQNVDTATVPKDAFPVLKNSKNNAPAVCKFCDGTNFGYSNENKGFTHDFTNVQCKCGEYQPASYNNEGSYYEIDTVSNLYWFAAQVNSGNTTINATLTDNITVNESVLSANGTLNETNVSSFIAWTPIGNDSSKYAGTFDGDGHTISGLYFNDTSVQYVGLFGYVKSSTVKNVGVIGSYFNGKSFVGGVCGYNDSPIGPNAITSTITSCYNTGTVSGDSYVGGVSGNNIGNITNCYNKGTVTGNSENYVGGVSGSNSGTIEKCYNAREGGNVCGKNRKTINNCYYLAVSETDSINGTTYKDKKAFTNGEVCYLLNGSTGTGDNLAWGQNVDSEPKDTLPVLNIGTNKAPAVYKFCTGQKAGYSNDSNSKIEHDFSAGQCVCGEYQPADKNNDGYYEIDTVSKLYWFAAQVNSGNNTINAKLTKDINVNESVLNADGTLADNASSFTVWTPIGNDSYKYTGEFDGDGRTISGLYLSNTNQSYVGLFGYVGSGGTVKNVGVIDSYFYGSENVGGVCGYNIGTITSCYNTGIVTGSSSYVGGVCGKNNNGTIKNCNNKGIVTGKNYVGGVCGSNAGEITSCYNTNAVTATNTDKIEYGNHYAGGVCGYNIGTITSCYNTGAVKGYDYVGGLIGQHNQNTTVTNCYNTGAVTIINDYGAVGGVIGNNGYSGTITSCYYDSTVYTGGKAIGNQNNTENVTGKATSAFTSGEVCYLLQSVQTSQQVWGQNLDNEPKDTYPKLSTDTNIKVYKQCSTEGIVYSNSEGTSEHKYNEKGICGCGAYKAAEDSNDDGYYEINNAGNLYWFAGLVNGTLDGVDQNKSAKAKLTADIIVNSDVITENGELNGGSFKAWTPIGNDSTDYQYTGEFDGAGHTISGLYFNDTNQSYIGLFGYVGSGGAVKNVGVINSYFKGKNYIGSVIGYNNGGTITSCYNTGTVIGNNSDVSTAQYVGGVIGYHESGTITSCYNTGVVTGTSNSTSYVGGVIGFNKNGTITSCYYDSTVHTGGKAVGNTDNTENVTGKATTAFASGEVCYLLNGSKSEGENLAWGQLLTGAESNKYPIYLTKSNADTHTVYGKYTTCDVSASIQYTNDKLSSERPEHNYTDNNGFCKVCGSYQPAATNGDVYEISNAGQLYWFAALVNGTLTDGTAKNDAAKAKLTANITIPSEKTWTPIGTTKEAPFKGEFDGNKKIVSGIIIDDSSKQVQGLFGCIENATVENVGVENGSISNSQCIGGICGYAKSNSSITNCYNKNTLDGINYVGGICGYTEGKNITITNCYSTSDSICGLLNGVTVTNCYYLANTDDNNGGKTKTQFESGEVCYLLNGSKSEGENLAWGQTVGTDGNAYPVFHNSTNTVYYGYDNGCSVTYSNSELSTVPTHTTSEGFKCSVCNTALVDITGFNTNYRTLTADWTPSVYAVNGTTAEAETTDITVTSGSNIITVYFNIDGKADLVKSYTLTVKNSEGNEVQTVTSQFKTIFANIGMAQLVHTLPDGTYDVSITLNAKNGETITKTATVTVSTSDEQSAA